MTRSPRTTWIRVSIPDVEITGAGMAGVRRGMLANLGEWRAECGTEHSRPSSFQRNDWMVRADYAARDRSLELCRFRRTPGSCSGVVDGRLLERSELSRSSEKGALERGA
jgi:hypothetical protein